MWGKQYMHAQNQQIFGATVQNLFATCLAFTKADIRSCFVTFLKCVLERFLTVPKFISYQWKVSEWVWVIGGMIQAKKNKLLGEVEDCSIPALFFTNPTLAGLGFKPLRQYVVSPVVKFWIIYGSVIKETQQYIFLQSYLTITVILLCVVLGFHGSNCEDYCLLGL